MDKENKNLQNDESIKLVQEAFGFGNTQLLNQFSHAEQESLKQKMDKKAARSGYRKLVAEIDLRGVKKYEDENGGKKPFRLKRMWKPLLLAAVLGAMVFGVATGTYGRKYYRYTAREVDGSKDKRARNDGEMFTYENDVVNSYELIQNSLEITTLELRYLPKDMMYVDTQIAEGRADLIFLYKDNYMSFSELKFDMEVAGGYASDCETYEIVYNEWLEKEIKVGKNILDNGKVEYRASFELGDGFYILRGIMGEDQFTEIIENISYFK